MRSCRLWHAEGPDLITAPFGFHTLICLGPIWTKAIVRKAVCSGLLSLWKPSERAACVLLACSPWFAFLSVWTQEMKRIWEDKIRNVIN